MARQACPRRWLGTPPPSLPPQTACAEWTTAGDAFSTGVVRGVERFLRTEDVIESLRAAGAGLNSAAAAARACSVAAQLYSSGCLLAYSNHFRHMLRRELAREGVVASFKLAMWPEDIEGVASVEASLLNPYEDGPDLPYGAAIIKLWAGVMRGSASGEPFVWKQTLDAEAIARFESIKVRTRKGVAYVLTDLRLCD